VLYSEVREENFDERAANYVFHEGKIDVYVHRCFIINQITTAMAIALRDAAVRRPSLFDIYDSDIVSLKVTKLNLK
jgi:hypothetical protein